jgi:hypothetical protein
LVPLNRSRHSLPDLPDSITTSQPTNSTTPTSEDLVIDDSVIDTASLDTINSKLSELAINDAIDTPIRRAMPKVMSKNNQTLAENAIIKRQLAEIQKVVSARQERKNSKRSVLKGRNVVSTLEVLEELKKCEDNTKLRGRRGGLERGKIKRISLRSLRMIQRMMKNL